MARIETDEQIVMEKSSPELDTNEETAFDQSSPKLDASDDAASPPGAHEAGWIDVLSPSDSGRVAGSTVLDDLDGSTNPTDQLGDLAGTGSQADFVDERSWAMDGGPATGGDPTTSAYPPDPDGFDPDDAPPWYDIAKDVPEMFDWAGDYDYMTQPRAAEPPVGSFVEDTDDVTNSGFVSASDYWGVDDPDATAVNREGEAVGGSEEEPTSQSGGGHGESQSGGEEEDDSGFTGYFANSLEGEEEEEGTSQDRGRETQPEDDEEERQPQGEEDDPDSGSEGGSSPQSGGESTPIPPEADDGTGGGDPGIDELDGSIGGDIDPTFEAEPAGGGQLDGSRGGDVDWDPDGNNAGGGAGLDRQLLGTGVIDPMDATTEESSDHAELAEALGSAEDVADVDVALQEDTISDIVETLDVAG